MSSEEGKNGAGLSHRPYDEAFQRAAVAQWQSGVPGSRDEVVAGMRRVDNAVKTVLLAFPRRAGELVGLPPAAIQRWASAWVHESLTTLFDPRNPVYGG